MRTLGPRRTPAEVTNVSIPPNTVSAVFIKSATSVSTVTSVRWNFAVPPFSMIVLSVFSPSSALISPRTTFAPALAYSIAVAAPIPVDPPVITATLLSSRTSMHLPSIFRVIAISQSPQVISKSRRSDTFSRKDYMWDTLIVQAFFALTLIWRQAGSRYWIDGVLRGF